MGEGQADEPSELVRFLAAMPGTPEGLLAQHVPDRTGHCAGCSYATIGSPVWLCTLACVAQAAVALARRRPDERT